MPLADQMTHDLVLHIGANKTGSTAIQYFLWRNLKAIRRAGFQIPGEALDWTSLVTGAHVASLQAMLASQDARAQITAAFEKLFSARPEQVPILISAENLSNPGHSAHFRDVCKKYKTKIILYIRRQDDLLASSWQQWYSKFESDFNAWLINGLQSIGHWEALINGWENVAGPGSVTVRIYERDEFPDGSIAKDFLGAIGVSATDESFNFSNDILNPTYSEFITPLVAGNKSIFKDVHDSFFYDLIGEFTGNHYVSSKRYSVMSKAQRDNIIRFYGRQNQHLCDKYFPGRKRLFKPVDHRNYIYADAAEVQQEQLRFLTHMVFELARRVRGDEAHAKEASEAAPDPETGQVVVGKSGKGRSWWGK